MEEYIFQRRNIIITSILILTIGVIIAVSQHNTYTTPEANTDSLLEKIKIVHCWRYDQSDTGISCKKTLNQCSQGWTEGYPPYPKKCP